MPEIRFERGQFQSFRAIVGFHLGELEQDVSKGDVVEFDGVVLRRGPDEVAYAKLRGAINQGWLVPAEQEGGEYIPRPAGVEVRPAQSTGRDRGPVSRVGVVADEERDVGALNQVRPSGAPATHTASNAGVVRPKVISEGGSEGRVVARGRFSAGRGDKVDISKGEDLAFKKSIEKQPVTTVQVKENVGVAISGDDLEELLPDAAVAGESAVEREARLAKAQAEAEARRAERMGVVKKAEAGAKTQFGEEAKVGSGGAEAIRNTQARVASSEREIDTSARVIGTSSGIGGAEDGRVVGRVGQPRQAAVPAPEELAGVEDDLSDLVADDGPPIEVGFDEETSQTPPDAIIQAKIEMIRQFVPGFDWDMSQHWKSRVKKALEYKGNMPVLNAILSLEVDSVRKHVMQALYGS